MVSAQNDSIPIEPVTVRDFKDKISEIRRFHSGVSAVLIHLVCCCFNQDIIIKPCRLPDARFNNQFVCRAEGWNPAEFHPLLPVI